MSSLLFYFIKTKGHPQASRPNKNVFSFYFTKFTEWSWECDSCYPFLLYVPVTGKTHVWYNSDNRAFDFVRLYWLFLNYPWIKKNDKFKMEFAYFTRGSKYGIFQEKLKLSKFICIEILLFTPQYWEVILLVLLLNKCFEIV